MTHRTSYRGTFAGAMVLIAALTINAPTASAQQRSPEDQASARAAMDEAVKALDQSQQLKKLSQRAKRELVEFAIGNVLFVMAHEMGHVLINEMDLPVLGREEDAADSYAVLVALQLQTSFSERVLLEAAKGWFLSSRRDKKEGNALAFYDEHGLDLQRAYNVVCMMHGSNPEKFKELAEEAKLPEERQPSCRRDFRNAQWSWDQVLKQHRRGPDGPRTTHNVTYKDEEKYPVASKVLREIGVLEFFANHATEGFTWRSPFSLVARSCDEPNATWNIGERTLTLCYELVEEFVDLFADYSKELPRSHRPKQ